MTQHLPKRQISAFFSKYRLGEVRAASRLLKGSVNTLYKVRTTQGKYVLKIFAPQTDRKYLEYEIDLLNHALKSGVRVPKIYSSDRGTIDQFSNRPAIVMEFLEGKHTFIPGIQLARTVGDFLGKYHAAISGFTPKHAAIITPSLEPLTLSKKIKRELKRHPVMNERLSHTLPMLEEMDFSKLPKGPIHNDFHQYNLLFIDNKINGLLDFRSFIGPYIYDIASAILRFCTAKGNLDKDLANALLSAYEKRRKLSANEREALPQAIILCVFDVIDYYLPRGEELPRGYRKERDTYISLIPEIQALTF